MDRSPHKTQTAPPSRMARCCPSQCSGIAIQTVLCRLDALTLPILILWGASAPSSSPRPAVPAHASGGRSAQNSVVPRQRLCSTPTPAIRRLKVRIHPIQTQGFSSLLRFHSLEFAECSQVRHLIRASSPAPTQTLHLVPLARLH